MNGAAGSTYLRARSYDPLRGQLLQRDTVSPNGPGTQGYAGYGYAGNGPVTRTDPSGRCVGCGGGMLALQAYQVELAGQAPTEVGPRATMAQRTRWVVSAFALVAAVLLCAVTPQCRDLGFPVWGDVDPGVTDAALGVADRAYTAAAGAMAAAAALVPDFPNLDEAMESAVDIATVVTVVGVATAHRAYCTAATAAGFRLTEENKRDHVEKGHGPYSTGSLGKSKFTAEAWNNLASLMALTVALAPLPYAQYRGQRCRFDALLYPTLIGHQGGHNGPDAYWMRVVVQVVPWGKHGAGEVVTTFPEQSPYP